MQSAGGIKVISLTVEIESFRALSFASGRACGKPKKFGLRLDSPEKMSPAKAQKRKEEHREF
jgi:hypothetical protein